MKKLVVCGDSYMSPVLGKYAGTHFSEIIAKKLNYELIPFSHGGSSNGGICLQIQTAINMDLKPDLILVGTSFLDRMEWPINDIDKIEKFTVYDLLHDNELSLSTQYFKNFATQPKLSSKPISYIFYENFADCSNDKFVNDRLESLKYYFNFLYHPTWKKQIDEMMLYAVFHQLHQSNIPYFICCEPGIRVANKCSWLNFGNSAHCITSQVAMIIEKYNTVPYHEPEYHTSVDCQLEIAELLIEKIKSI